MSNYSVTSAAGRRMMKYIPGFYETSRVAKAGNQVRGAEIDKLRRAINETLDQFFIDTATWSLDVWEHELGLVPGPGLSTVERREQVRAKLRGIGTCNIYLVKNTAEAYDNGRVEVIQDNLLYKVTIAFVGTYGVPSNIESLKKALRAIVPAHLDIDFRYTYLIWSELDKAQITWDELDAMNMTWDELQVWNPFA